ncbi:hypothetical protein AB0L44_04790 [Nonomuraea wenchangensis]|uniref:hypothetical protein n=1 Tax=Nonomuraea wenchangensis TaxID=568860 RepID=UPI0034414654
MAILGEERWHIAIRDRAATLAFPEWTPRAEDRAQLHTGFIDDGTPYTEVSVYRDDDGRQRIHYRRYIAEELQHFWTRLMSESGD